MLVINFVCNYCYYTVVPFSFVSFLTLLSCAGSGSSSGCVCPACSGDVVCLCGDAVVHKETLDPSLLPAPARQRDLIYNNNAAEHTVSIMTLLSFLHYEHSKTLLKSTIS